MFNLEQAITEWRRELLVAGIRTSEALDELETHLREDVERQVHSGLGMEQAFNSAVQHLGDANELKGEYAKTAELKRRRSVYCGLGLGVGLFILGLAFCYFALIPSALAASQAYFQWLGFSPTHWNPGEYISFVRKFILGMGLAIEMPVVILTLVKIGVLNCRLLAKARKYVMIINLTLGAVLTTPELTTQLMMSVPLQVLYEVSVWTARYWDRRDKQRATPAEPSKV